MLGKLEREIVAEVNDYDPTAPAQSTYRQQRLQSLLKQTKATIESRYKGISQHHIEALKGLAEVENNYTLKMLDQVIGVNGVTVGLPGEALVSLAKGELIKGAQSEEWWGRQAVGLTRRFDDTIRNGFLRGESVDKLVQRVRGTRDNAYADGIMSTSRREAEALVRTSVQNVANSTRQSIYEENTDVCKGIQWIATLDQRTTVICMGLNGLTWSLPDYKPIDHKQEFPGPTAHWGCRSTQIPVLKSWQEIAGDGGVIVDGHKVDLQREYERQLEGMGISPEEAKKSLVDGRASMDGEVSRTLTFDKWLADKPDHVADKMLGPGRAKMFREGKIGLTDMLDQKNRPLTLEQLAKME